MPHFPQISLSTTNFPTFPTNFSPWKSYSFCWKSPYSFWKSRCSLWKSHSSHWKSLCSVWKNHRSNFTSGCAIFTNQLLRYSITPLLHYSRFSLFTSGCAIFTNPRLRRASIYSATPILHHSFTPNTPVLPIYFCGGWFWFAGGGEVFPFGDGKA